jgi:hypothetical protein
MTLIEPSLLCSPLLATAAGTQQGRIVVTDNDGFIDAAFRQAIALERAA